MTEPASPVADDGAGDQPANAVPQGDPGVGGGDGAADVDQTSLDAKHSGAGGTSSNAVTVERLLRQASSNYVHGDMVGGDKYIVLRGDRQPAPVREIPALLRDPVKHAFVDPDDWPATRAAFRARRLILLRGEPGHGRVAAAIRLLQVPSDRPIFNLDRDVDLRRLPQWLEEDAAADRPLPLGAGFLLCDPGGQAELEGWMLHQLTGALTRRDARMVITVGIDRALNDDELRDYVVPLGVPRPHTVILASHLGWRLSQRPHGDSTVADRLLGRDDVREFVATALADGVPVKRAADLAVMIDQEFDGVTVDLERLRQRLAEREVEDFDIWFGALPDVPTRCLAIALAVLNGLPATDVIRAAGMLTERLDGPPQLVVDAAPRLRPPWRDPFADTRRERMRLLRARTRVVTVQGDLGQAPVEVMEYLDDGRPDSVLDHVWHEYQLHRPLLDWLRDLSRESSEDVRIWTGMAFGLLATYDFELVYGGALRAMAIDPQRNLRDVVAYALRLPAADRRLFRLVRRVANRLHWNRDAPLGQATSARLRAIAFGPRDVPGVLEKLDRLAIFDDYRIAWSIGDALADLMVQNEAANTPLVLGRITDWLADRRRHRVAQWAFHQLAQSLRTDLETKADGSYASWPTLLLVADQRPELRPALIGIWARVLNTGEFTDRVDESIDNWATWADSYDDVRTAFVRLLSAIAATSPRTRAIVLRHVARWIEPENLFPMHDTADAVKDALNARNDAS